MNERLIKTIGKAVRGMSKPVWIMLDAYNLAVKGDVSCTITTRTNTANHTYLFRFDET